MAIGTGDTRARLEFHNRERLSRANGTKEPARNNRKGRRVAKPERGKKHTCHSCGALFYDFKRKTIICPKCGDKVEVRTLLKPRRPAPRPQAAIPAPEEKPEPAKEDADKIEDVEIEIEDVEEEDEDGLMEDTSDIGDDDMPEVKEHTGPKGDDKE